MGDPDQDKTFLEEVYCENNILKQCLEEKAQELDNLKNFITLDKATVYQMRSIVCKNNVSTAAACQCKAERFNKEIQLA